MMQTDEQRQRVRDAARQVLQRTRSLVLALNDFSDTAQAEKQQLRDQLAERMRPVKDELEELRAWLDPIAWPRGVPPLERGPVGKRERMPGETRLAPRAPRPRADVDG